MSQLRKAVRDYLTMRRSLGFKLTKHEAALLDFVSFLAQRRCSHITVKMALAWATRNKNQRPDEWAARLSLMRGFARYWSATDPSTEIPPVGLPPIGRSAPGRISFPRLYLPTPIRRNSVGCEQILPHRLPVVTCQFADCLDAQTLAFQSFHFLHVLPP